MSPQKDKEEGWISGEDLRRVMKQKNEEVFNKAIGHHMKRYLFWRRIWPAKAESHRFIAFSIAKMRKEMEEI